MFSIFKKEINSFLSSITAYIIMAVFLISMGLFVWVFPAYSVLDFNYADLSTFFNIAPYIFLFLIPALTMRSFSEEFRSGTIELLFTKPLSNWQIVLGKFWANWLLLALCLLPTIIYYASVSNLGSPEGNIDTAAVVGSYLGLLLLGGVFCAIGVWASAQTDNQVVAFIIAIFVSFLLYLGLGFTAQIFSGTAELLLNYLSLDYHYQSLGKGLINSQNVLYLSSIAILFLLLTVQTLKRFS